MAVQTFRSRIDTWLLVVMLGAPVLVLASVLPDLPGDPAGLAAVAVVVVVSAGLPVWLLATTRYALSADTLQVTSGPFRWTVRVADITSVIPTRSMVSSPALSLHRLEIRYGRSQSIMISPDDQEAFLQALDERRRAAVQPGVIPGNDPGS